MAITMKPSSSILYHQFHWTTTKMMMSVVLVLIVVATKTSVVMADAHSPAQLDCILECQHSKTGCQLSSDADMPYWKQIQSGHLVNTCGECEPGWTGVGCSIPVLQCGTSNDSCPGSGGCIVDDDTGMKRCADCALAEHVSRFTGSMCKNIYTEYCASSYEDLNGKGNLQFCTNGGKCFYSGQSRDDRMFEHCNCPPEYEGPHCEFSKFPEWDATQNPQFKSSTTVTTAGSSRDGSSASSLPPYGVALVVFAMLAVLAAGVVFFKRTRQKAKQEDDYNDAVPLALDDDAAYEAPNAATGDDSQPMWT